MNKSLSYLLTPSNSKINPPINTKKSDLPIEDLGWEDFEKLCLKLVEIDNSIDDCEIYGIKGQKQNGIDIFAKQDNGKYSSAQCKKYKSLSVANFTKAVNLFKKETWYLKSDEFIFCTTFKMNKTQLQDKFNLLKTELKKDGVKLVKWDKIQICKILKSHPQIVYDFFGRQWVELFNGPEFIDSISTNRKLDANEVLEFRNELSKFYSILFNTHDSGIGLQQIDNETSPLQERFIMPDTYEYHLPLSSLDQNYIDEDNSNIDYEESINKMSPDRDSNLLTDLSHDFSGRKNYYSDNYIKNRVGIDVVITKNDKSIIIGDPGSGKSTLLRNLVLDILSEHPKFGETKESWRKCLPIWIPFAFITKNLKKDNNLSISDLLRIWFRAYEKENLFEIINSALFDERLILIIDGVDELADIPSAQNAISKIEIHTSLNGTKALYSSRPYGFNILRESFANIHEVHLLPFSEEQQKKFIFFWFEKWMKSIGKDDVRYISKLTLEFLKSLSENAELKNIAQTPLLLSILTSQRLRDSSLPSNKTKALEKITEYLINTHPNKRKVSANVTESEYNNYSFDLIDIFQELAIYIQTNFNDGVIEKTEAKKVIENYLKEFLGFSIPEAKKSSQDIFDIGANEYGLLIEKTSTEIAFAHRLFQEYLAGKYLFSTDEEYKEIISKYGGNPLWHQVIKLYFSLIPQNKTKYYQESIELLGSANEEYKQLLLFLKYDIVLTSSNSPLNLSKEYLTSIIPLFEYETNRDVKWIYWKLLLNGLRNIKLKRDIKDYLFRYYPNYYKYIDYRLFSIGNIAIDNFNIEIGEFLIKNIINGNSSQQKLASSTIGIFLINKEFLDRISSLIENTSNPIILSLLINSFIHKNVDEKVKLDLLKKYKNTDDYSIQLFVIKLKVHLNKQETKDFENFIKIQNSFDFEYKDEILQILIDGWPKEEKLLKICLDSLEKHRFRGDILIDNEIAWKVLLHCFNKDKRVLDRIINEIKEEEYPFIGFSSPYKIWNHLSHYYKNNQKLSKVADEWLQNQEFQAPAIAYASQIGKTEKTKQFLIKFLPKASFSHWITMALVEGWKDDNEVIEFLKEYFESDAKNKYASYGYFDLVYQNDTDKGIQLLTNYINDPESEYIDRAISALVKLDKKYFKEKLLYKVIKEHLPKLEKNDILNRYNNLIHTLLENYCHEKIVKDYAFEHIINDKDNLHLIIKFYGVDTEAIKRILNKSLPLDVDFRLELLNKFQEIDIVDLDILNELSKFDDDGEEVCMSTAAIGLFKHLQSNNPAKLIQISNKKVFYRGFDYEIHRQVGFCGYILTQNLPAYFSLIEEGTNNKANPEITYDTYNNKLSNAITELYIDNFELIYNEINGDFKRVQRYSSEEQNAWSFWAKHSNKNSPSYPYIMDYIKENEQIIKNNDLLSFLERTIPTSKILKNICLRLVKEDKGKYSANYFASKILGENFNTDNSVYNEISSIKNMRLESAKIVALCIGWPESAILKKIYGELVEDNYGVSGTVTYHLKFLFKDVTNIMQFFNYFFTDFNEKYHEHQHFIKPLMNRLKKDEELQVKIKEELLISNSIHSKVSYYSLLDNLNKIDKDIIEWRKNKNQIDDYNNYGYDISKNRLSMFKDIVNPIFYDL